jgi:lipopolysaccharide biosynthesis glycosyltransferase
MHDVMGEQIADQRSEAKIDASVKPIHIALASDNRGTVGLAVSVYSLLKATTRPVHVWIIEHGIDRESQRRLEKCWRSVPSLQQVNFLSQSDLPQPVPAWWARKNWPLASCSRFQLAEILPANVQRCIYLDIDILVGTDVGALFDLDLGGHPIGMVQNYNQPESDRAYVASLGCNPEEYGNAGVLLIDLDAWRREKVGAGLIEHGRSMRPDLWFFDQDMLNTYFKGHCAMLDWIWNFRDAGVTPDGRIQHFAGKPKPWETDPQTVSAIGMIAWHRTRQETGFVPTPPSLASRVRNNVVNVMAWIERQVRRRFRSVAAGFGFR